MANNKLIIVHADDYGMNKQVTEGILQGLKRGIINRTTLMVKPDTCSDAVTIAKDEGLWGHVGLHLDLTGILNIGCADLIHKVRKTTLKKEEIQLLIDDIRRQMDRYMSYEPALMHIDSHHHTHVEPQLFRIVAPLAIEYGFKSMRISRNLMGHDVKSLLKMFYKTAIGINRKIGSSFERTDFFGSYVDYCNYYAGKGSVEVMVHPIMIDGAIIDLTGNRNQNMESYIYEK